MEFFHQIFIPEIILLFLALALLAGAVFVEPRLKNDSILVSWPLGCAVLVLAGLVFQQFGHLGASVDDEAVVGLFDQWVGDDLTIFFRAFLLLLALPIFVALRAYLVTERHFSYEYGVLMLLAMLGLFLMVGANDFLLFYVGVELQALAFYALAAMRVDSKFSVEAGIKYFLGGVLASIFLLLGIALVYFYTGTTNFDNLRLFLLMEQLGESMPVSPLLLAFTVLWLGIFTKLGAAPVHYWALDVYHGSPLAVMGFFSVLPKVGLVAFCIRLYYHVLGGFGLAYHKGVRPALEGMVYKTNLLFFPGASEAAFTKHLGGSHFDYSYLDLAIIYAHYVGPLARLTAAFQEGWVLFDRYRELANRLYLDYRFYFIRSDRETAGLGLNNVLQPNSAGGGWGEVASVSPMSQTRFFPFSLETDTVVDYFVASGFNRLLVLVGVISIVWGAWAGIGQTSLKRLFAYSSLTNVGFILLTFVGSTVVSLQTTIFYVTVYSLTTLLFFLLLVALHVVHRDSVQSVTDLPLVRPLLGIPMLLTLLGLAGIPPTPGFAIKLAVFQLLVAEGYHYTLIVVVVASLLSIFFYLRLVVSVFFTKSNSVYMSALTVPLPRDLAWSIFILFIFVNVVLLFLVPELFEWCLDLAISIFSVDELYAVDSQLRYAHWVKPIVAATR